MKPTLDFDFEMVKMYNTNVTNKECQARYQELDDLLDQLILQNIEERKLRDPSQQESDDKEEEDSEMNLKMSPVD
jgi:hypothetical protein